jgi:hypothetical protein
MGLNIIHSFLGIANVNLTGEAVIVSNDSVNSELCIESTTSKKDTCKRHIGKRKTAHAVLLLVQTYLLPNISVFHARRNLL